METRIPAFPDVILNVRDMLAVDIRSWSDDVAVGTSRHTLPSIRFKRTS